MSTFEQTVSMLESLPEDDVKVIHNITYRFYIREHSPLKPVTREQILKDLAVSRNKLLMVKEKNSVKQSGKSRQNMVSKVIISPHAQ